MKRLSKDGWEIYSCSEGYDIDDLLKCVDQFSLLEKGESVSMPESVSVLKSDYRSMVLKFYFKGQFLVAKCPREKHTRKWSQFVTKFKDSEVMTATKKMERIDRLALEGNKAIAVFEKRVKGMVVYSWQLYTFQEGGYPPIEEFYKVKVMLQEIHRKGYLHGDSQIHNFLYTPEKKIAVIDADLKHNRLGSFGRSMEYEYLCRSHEAFRPLFVTESKRLSYKLYCFFKFLQLRFRDIKKIRELFGYKKNRL